MSVWTLESVSIKCVFVVVSISDLCTAVNPWNSREFTSAHKRKIKIESEESQNEEVERDDQP